MTDLENRIKRRLVMETGEADLHEHEIGKPLECDDIWTAVDQASRIAALEAEDTANPIAATAVVRKDALDTAGPDLDAFAAAFATALTQHDEEYL